MLDHITDALIVVILWRGHYPMTMRLIPRSCCYGDERSVVSFKVPIHSIISFVWATILACDFEKVFSFFFFLIGWIFLATMEYKRKHPSEWRKPRSYNELMSVLLFNKSFVHPRMICSNDNIEKIKQFESDVADRVKAKHEAIERVKFYKQKQEKRLAAEEADAGEGGGNYNTQNNTVDITTKAKNDGFTELILIPFKHILMPIQKKLYQICVILRVVSSVVLWRDSYAAFWIVTGSFVLSFIVFWIPWAFIIKWTFRIFIWTFTGPWMKLFDIYYVQRKQNISAEERAAQMEADYERRYNLVLGEWSMIRIRKENAAKMKDMKRYMFGQFLMRVPVFKEERFPYEPAYSSSSTPFNESSRSPSASASVPSPHKEDDDNDVNKAQAAAHRAPHDVNIVRYINGQHLSGDMVPFREKNKCHD